MKRVDPVPKQVIYLRGHLTSHLILFDPRRNVLHLWHIPCSSNVVHTLIACVAS